MPFTAKPKTVLSRDEVMQMVYDCFEKWAIDEEKALETGALISLLYRTGARISEALGMRKDDVKLDEKFMYLTVRSLKQADGKIAYRVLPFRLYEDIEKNFFNKIFLAHAKTKEKGQLLWEFTRRTAENRLYELAPHLYLHIFRHSLATRLADVGQSDAQLRRWFGWAYTSKMPMNYTNLAKIHMIPISEAGDID